MREAGLLQNKKGRGQQVYSLQGAPYAYWFFIYLFMRKVVHKGRRGTIRVQLIELSKARKSEKKQKQKRTELRETHVYV